MPSTPGSVERILLFIPMYNCAKQIPRVLAQITPEVREWITEVIVIDNGSTDGSREVAADAIQSLGVKASVRLNADNYSLGGSHKVAFNYARANGFDYIIVFHGDDQGSIGDIVEPLRRGEHRKTGCLLGARFMPGSALVGYSTLRIILNKIVNLAFSLVLLRRVYDIGSGLNLYDVRSLEGGFYLSFPNTLLFNVYLLLYYYYKKMTIGYFPITWREEDQISNARLVPMGFAMIRVFLGFVFARRRLLSVSGETERNIDYRSSPVYANFPLEARCRACT